MTFFAMTRMQWRDLVQRRKPVAPTRSRRLKRIPRPRIRFLLIDSSGRVLDRVAHYTKSEARAHWKKLHNDPLFFFASGFRVVRERKPKQKAA
jgi:hypothetical protein